MEIDYLLLHRLTIRVRYKSMSSAIKRKTGIDRQTDTHTHTHTHTPNTHTHTHT